MQENLFAWSDKVRDAGSGDRRPRKLRVMITVTAAPNPSAMHGETVCVAGLEVGLETSRWVRLYPINLRHLTEEARFHKYDIVEVEATPATGDSRIESWKPDLSTLRIVSRQRQSWARRDWVDPTVQTSMCALQSGIEADPAAQSLALIRPSVVHGLDLARHPGWNPDEQAKINAYVNQLDLFDPSEKVPLEAPRFKGWYRYSCAETTCKGHRQGVLDWEFVAYQRRLTRMDDRRAEGALRERFLDMVCAPAKDTCFYVGNQAKRRHVFSIIGMYYPPAS